MNLPCLQCFGSGPRVDQNSTGPMDSDPDSEILQGTRGSRKEEKNREYIQELDVLLYRDKDFSNVSFLKV
jgi:hypothetical protein